MNALTRIRIDELAQRVANPDWKEDEPHYYVGSPSGGGIAKKFTLRDALETAAEMTSDEVPDPEAVLIVTNEMNYVICLFCDGFAYIKADAWKGKR